MSTISVSYQDVTAMVPFEAFAGIKRNRTQDIEKKVRELQEEKHVYFVDCWYSDDARRLIGEAAKKF
jgi:hypothetical protein